MRVSRGFRAAEKRLVRERALDLRLDAREDARRPGDRHILHTPDFPISVLTRASTVRLNVGAFHFGHACMAVLSGATRLKFGDARMSEPKSLEHDTTPQTPHSKRTIAVRTGRSDPPPSPYPPSPRPAAGTPAVRDPEAKSRGSTTLPRAVRSPRAPARSRNPFWFGAALFVMVMSALLMFAARR